MTHASSGDPSFAPLPGRPTALAIGVPRTLLVVTIEHLAARVTAAAGEVALFLDSWLLHAARPLGGKVARVDGDHAVVVFKDAGAGVRCALELQNALASAERGGGGRPPTCRIMVTTGSVVPWQGDVLTSLVSTALNHCRAEKRPYAVLVDDTTRNLAPLAGRTLPLEDREASLTYVFEAAPDGLPFAALLAEAGDDETATRAGVAAWLEAARQTLAPLRARVAARPRVALAAAGVAVLLVVVIAALTGGDDARSGASPQYAQDDIRGWPVDELVGYLGDDDVEDIVAELKRRPPAEVKEAMVKEVETGSYLRRHRALQVLEAGGSPVDEHYQTVAIRDVENGPTCEAWIEGLEVLEARAVDERALDALTALKARKGAKACVDFPATEAAIRARLAGR